MDIVVNAVFKAVAVAHAFHFLGGWPREQYGVVVEVHCGLVCPSVLVQTTVDFARCVEVGHKYVVVNFPVAPHVGHDDAVERGVEEHAVADNEFACHFSTDKTDGLVGWVAHRHNASRFAAFGTSEACVGRVGLGVFVHEAEVEEDAVDDDLSISFCGGINHEQALSDSAPLGYGWLYACDIFDRISFAEVVVPPTFEAYIFALYFNPAPVQIAEIVALCNTDEVAIGCLVNGFLNIFHRGFECSLCPGATSFKVYIIDVAVGDGGCRFFTGILQRIGIGSLSGIFAFFKHLVEAFVDGAVDCHGCSCCRCIFCPFHNVLGKLGMSHRTRGKH